MRFTSLDQWLEWQEGLHPTEIDLGLERIRTVLKRLGLEQPSYSIVTIAGTNGKGSSVVMLESILSSAGYRVGAYTSPHLLHYNERIHVAGKEVSDQTLCQAFERIDQARHGTSLTYFEFGTLAAIDIFETMDLDIALLEVGLGGRLDAVNVLDSDVALVTTIGIDHVEWLGDDREKIGREKAGIFRPKLPAVCVDPDPPTSVLKYAEDLNTPLYCLNRDYGYKLDATNQWSWFSAESNYNGLPEPVMSGAFQIQNAAGVLKVLELLGHDFPVSLEAIQAGLCAAKQPGRFQQLSITIKHHQDSKKIQAILDVAHNPQAAATLAQTLKGTPCTGKTYAVVGMRKDKDIEAIIEKTHSAIDSWYLAGVDSDQSASTDRIFKAIKSSDTSSPVIIANNIVSAWNLACSVVQAEDRIVVFGSFRSVAEAVSEIENSVCSGATVVN